MSTILKSLLFFAYSFAMAHYLDWQATDIAWSMWFASITVGGCLIFTSIVFSKIIWAGELNAHDIAKALGSQIPKEKLENVNLDEIPSFKVPKIGALLGSLFFLGFFAVHFGMFHWGHSQFLVGFFPLDGLEKNPSLLDTVLVCAGLYWPFMIASFLSYADDFKKNLQGLGSLSMIKPYKTVVKNHIIILVLGFLNAFNVGGYTLYLLLFFYFFPYEEIWAHVKNPDKKKAETDPSPLTVDRN